MHFELDELPGRTVLDADGWVVGRICALLVERDSWLVDTIRVRLRRSVANRLGIPWSPFRMPTVDVPTGMIHAAGDAIILRAGISELGELPASHVSLLEAAA